MPQTGDSAAARLRELSREERRLLWVLGFSFLVNQYDMALIGLALPQIQADLRIPESALGPLVGVVKLGALGALALSLAADSAGRRRLLLFTILGFTLFTAASALARTPVQFVALQVAARACISAEEVIAIVLVAEQVRARGRGLGFGILAIFGAFGYGTAAVSYGFVEALPFGWRALYAAGVVPLLALAWIRRTLRESERFESARARRRGGAVRWLQPLRELFATQPARLGALLASTLAFGFFVSPALAFVSKTLQDAHGWSPPEVTLLFVGAGSLTLASYPLAGSLSDRFGRRRILVLGLLTNAVGVIAFYTASGPALVVAWIAMMFGFMSCDVLFGALGAELFGTMHRVTASGARMLALGGGGALGLAVEGLLYAPAGSHAAALSWMAAAAALAAAIVGLAIPETAARELEHITPDVEAPAENALRDESAIRVDRTRGGTR